MGIAYVVYGGFGEVECRVVGCGFVVWGWGGSFGLEGWEMGCEMVWGGRVGYGLGGEMWR
jgi:hypothetical protein